MAAVLYVIYSDKCTC